MAALLNVPIISEEVIKHYRRYLAQMTSRIIRLFLRVTSHNISLYTNFKAILHLYTLTIPSQFTMANANSH